MTISFPRMAVAAVVVAAAAGCGAPVPVEPAPRTIHAGAPGEAAREGTGSPTAPIRHTEADVQFMQHMILHHAQALAMTGMVDGRTESGDIRLLARRIDVSQRDEIEFMQQWLTARGASAPAADPHHHHRGGDDHHGQMPGMLTHEELMRLESARGAEFDRLFLEFMIHHHEGAVTMVADLFATAGAGQETEIYQFASHVDSDQQIEIERMRRMLAGRR